MAVELNHTIIPVSDRKSASEWVAEMLGLEPPKVWGPFHGIHLANGVELDFDDDHGEIRAMHYAFLISEQEFDEIYDRIVERGVEHWADPMQSRPGEINHNDGGRGVYFLGPDGHFLEVITRPYGSGA